MNWRMHYSMRWSHMTDANPQHHYDIIEPTCLHCCLTCSESLVMESWHTLCISSNTSLLTNLRPKMAWKKELCLHVQQSHKIMSHCIVWFHSSASNMTGFSNGHDNVYLQQRKGSTLTLMVIDVLFNKAEQDGKFILRHILLFEVPQDHCHCLMTSQWHHHYSIIGSYYVYMHVP